MTADDPHECHDGPASARPPHAGHRTRSGGHGHDHVGAAGMLSAGGRHRRRLLGAFAITATVLVVQAVGAFLTGSLALLSDTGHMATDVLGLGMALAAVEASRRIGASPARPFGVYRLEILAAAANAVLLFAVGGYALAVGYGPDHATLQVEPEDHTGCADVTW